MHFSPSEADFLCRLVVVVDLGLIVIIVNVVIVIVIVIIVNALTIFDEYLLSANWLKAQTKAKIFFHKNIVCNLVQVWSGLFYFSKLESRLVLWLAILG